MSDDTISIKLKGSAGQSLGAFLTKGITLTVEEIAMIMSAKVSLEAKLLLNHHLKVD